MLAGPNGAARLLGMSRSTVRRGAACAVPACQHGCRPAQMDPLTESRILAMLHVSVHDAVNAVAPRYRPYRFAGRAPDASAEAGRPRGRARRARGADAAGARGPRRGAH